MIFPLSQLRNSLPQIQDCLLKQKMGQTIPFRSTSLLRARSFARSYLRSITPSNLTSRAQQMLNLHQEAVALPHSSTDVKRAEYWLIRNIPFVIGISKTKG